ncbi:hypothetical protein LCGC14_2490800 [marine sediment metagenome]|uniref:DUF5131 family protein n=1 Tax=marine sediment metagenome TaxID=412755 RepID=A0A0F9B4W2_9ZZZZ
MIHVATATEQDELTASERLALYRGEKLTKTKIDWCDFSWNPVWGCRNNCPYCYARKLAKRFGDSEFKPTWKQKNFDKPFPKKLSRIFVNSMSDICWWPWEWMESVLKKIADNRMHTFLFLTKSPGIYFGYEFPLNCRLGATVTREKYLTSSLALSEKCDFVSIEPMLERIYPQPLNIFTWVIIGAETGNRKGKVIPKRKWIAEIVDYCKANQIPVFLKESLREIWGGELIQEYPK